MGLSCQVVARMKIAVGDNSGRKKPRDGSAGADPDTSRNLSGAAIGNSGISQDSEVLSRSKRLRPGLDCKGRERDDGEEKSRDQPEAKKMRSSIHNRCACSEAGAQPWLHRGKTDSTLW